MLSNNWQEQQNLYATDKEAWVKSLKPGDRVAKRVIKSSGWHRYNVSTTYNILTVVRITPKGYLRLSDNDLIKPDSFIYTSIQPVTQEILDAISTWDTYINLHYDTLDLMHKVERLIKEGKVDIDSLSPIYQALKEVTDGKEI